MSLTSAAVLWGGGYICIPHSAARAMVSLTAPKPEHDFPLVHENVTVRKRCAKLDRNFRLKAKISLTSEIFLCARGYIFPPHSAARTMVSLTAPKPEHDFPLVHED